MKMGTNCRWATGIFFSVLLLLLLIFSLKSSPVVPLSPLPWLGDISNRVCKDGVKLSSGQAKVMGDTSFKKYILFSAKPFIFTALQSVLDFREEMK